MRSLKWLSFAVGLMLVGAVAYAETDAKALAVISDIQNGKDNSSQIKTLRVSGSATVGGTVTATAFAGSGAGLTGVTGAALSAGYTMPAVNGAAITNLNGANLASGDIPAARMTNVLEIGRTVQAYDADLAAVAGAHSVISKGSTGLVVDYGSTTNGGTVTWHGGPLAAALYPVASYYGGATITNAGGYQASAAVVSANTTNCTVVGDAVDQAALIFVIGVGVQ